MPLVRCRYYSEDGSPIGEGCPVYRDHGYCDYVHPSDSDWARARNPRRTFNPDRPGRPPPKQDRGFSSYGGKRNFTEPSSKDSGWSKRQPSFGDRRASESGSGIWKAKNDSKNASWGSDWNDWNNWNSNASTNVPWMQQQNSASSPAANRTASAWGFGSPLRANSPGWGGPATWGTTVGSGNTWDITSEPAEQDRPSASEPAPAASEPSNNASTAAVTGTSGGWRTGTELAASTSTNGGWSTGAGPAASMTTSGGWPVIAEPPISTGTSGFDASADTANGRNPSAEAQSDLSWNAAPTNTKAASASAAQAAAGCSSSWTGSDPAASWSAAQVDNPPAEPDPRDSDWNMADDTSRPEATVEESAAPIRADKPPDAKKRGRSSKCGSRTSSRRASPVDLARLVRSRSVSPELPDGPVKSIKTLVKAVGAYAEWESTKGPLARAKHLLKGPQYAHVSDTVRDKVNQNLKRCEEDCERAQRRRDEALRALRHVSPYFGPTGQPESLKLSASDTLEQYEQYAAELKTWLDQIRPVLESRWPSHLLTKPPPHTRGRAGDLPVPAQQLDKQLLNFLHQAADKIHKMDTKVKELEAYQEGLRTGAQDSFDRVETTVGPFPPRNDLDESVPREWLKRQEAEMASIRSDLTYMRTEVAEVAQRKHVTLLDVQRLRAEQEQLRLKMMELEEANSAQRQESDKISSTLSELRSKIASLQERPRTSPAPVRVPEPALSPPEPPFTPDEIAFTLLPELHQAIRDDLDASLHRLREGFEEATAKQGEQLCNSVWTQLRPVLAVVRLISKNIELAGEDFGVGSSIAQIQPIALG